MTSGVLNFDPDNHAGVPDRVPSVQRNICVEVLNREMQWNIFAEPIGIFIQGDVGSDALCSFPIGAE
jgi:hypothetical protein